MLSGCVQCSPTQPSTYAADLCFSTTVSHIATTLVSDSPSPKWPRPQSLPNYFTTTTLDFVCLPNTASSHHASSKPTIPHMRSPQHYLSVTPKHVTFNAFPNDQCGQPKSNFVNLKFPLTFLACTGSSSCLLTTWRCNNFNRMTVPSRNK